MLDHEWFEYIKDSNEITQTILIKVEWSFIIQKFQTFQLITISSCSKLCSQNVSNRDHNIYLIRLYYITHSDWLKADSREIHNFTKLGFRRRILLKALLRYYIRIIIYKEYHIWGLFFVPSITNLWTGYFKTQMKH